MFRPSLPLEKERKHSLQLVLPELHTPGSPNENICLYIYTRLGGWRRRYTLAKRGSSRKTRSEFLFCVCVEEGLCVFTCAEWNQLFAVEKHETCVLLAVT
jgi:hypothetical protein